MLCFFDSVKQNTIYLGRYKGWAGTDSVKDYTTQLYEKGQMCPGNEWYACRATEYLARTADNSPRMSCSLQMK